MKACCVRARGARETKEKNEAESICRSAVPAISCRYYLLQVILYIPSSSVYTFLYSILIFVVFSSILRCGSIFFYCDWNLGSHSLGVIRVNGIDFEEIKVELFKRQQLSAEFKGTASYIHTYIYMYACVCAICHTYVLLSKNIHSTVVIQ